MNYSPLPAGLFQAFRSSPIQGFAVVMLTLMTAVSAEIGKTFPSPEEAANALAAAASTKSSSELKAVFGPAIEELRNPDAVASENELATFAAAFSEDHRIVRESDARANLEIGAGHWPFPIPLAQKNGRWFFDSEAGKEELFNRRIGRNELAALRTIRAYVEAQREYASRDRDGDNVLEYAQHILSSLGRKDGLYWPLEIDGEISPLGPLVAAAQEEGYRTGSGVKSGPKPFHGYYFKILTGQGHHAPGGQYNYIINGNMIGGFGLVAWPADYGNSGIMTFIVNQQGKVFQKDLGAKTEARAAAMKQYDPDDTWTVSRD